MTEADPEHLRAQVAFLSEIDRLKSVVRQNRLADGSRRENSAEHSWHLAMFAVVLADHAQGADVWKVVQMLLIHDIVEIDAGDHGYHEPNLDWDAIAAKERAAATRLFALLPAAQGEALRALWDEFEAAETPEARFAKALDRLQPVLLNVLAGGGTWNDHEVDEARVIERTGPAIAAGSPRLWAEARALIREHFAARR